MKKMKVMLVGIAALSIVCFLMAIVRAYDEYMDIGVQGNEMAPAIRDGDTIRVRMCMNGSLIKAGSLTSASPGDIIVYCSIAAWGDSSSMWMCGRAVSKYYDGKNWIIQTQLDSATEPDEWKVPEYDLLGVVAEVIHNTNAPAQQSTTNAEFTVPDLAMVLDFTVGIALGLTLAIIAKKIQARFRSLVATERKTFAKPRTPYFATCEFDLR